MGPYYADHRPAFFSLAGLSVATQIQMRIVTQFYGPILHDLARSAAILTANSLLQTYANTISLPGIITGASLSFHIFNQPGSVIEVNGANRNLPERSDVFLVGTAAIAAVEDLINAFDPSDVEDLDDVWNFFEGIVDAIQGAGQAFDDANQIADSTSFGACILPGSDSSCVDLVYDSGFGAVNKCSGFVCFPQPVIVLVHNLDTGGWSSGIFNFVTPR